MVPFVHLQGVRIIILPNVCAVCKRSDSMVRHIVALLIVGLASVSARAASVVPGEEHCVVNVADWDRLNIRSGHRAGRAAAGRSARHVQRPEARPARPGTRGARGVDRAADRERAALPHRLAAGPARRYPARCRARVAARGRVLVEAGPGLPRGETLDRRAATPRAPARTARPLGPGADPVLRRAAVSSRGCRDALSLRAICNRCGTLPH